MLLALTIQHILHTSKKLLEHYVKHYLFGGLVFGGNYIENELASYNLFVTEVADKQKRERIEFAIMQNVYLSKEPWGDLVDGQVALRGRANYEIPVEVRNICPYKIYGIPEMFEI